MIYGRYTYPEDTHLDWHLSGLDVHNSLVDLAAKYPDIDERQFLIDWADSIKATSPPLEAYGLRDRAAEAGFVVILLLQFVTLAVGAITIFRWAF